MVRAAISTRRRIIAGLAALPVAGLGARAQRPFPERPIRLIVAYGPGTGNDTSARRLTAGIQPFLGQSMIVENRPGANAVIGVETAARSAPDGYTLLYGAEQAMCINPALGERLPYDVERDFVPVVGLVSFPLVVVVASELPVRSIADLVALAKAQPGRLTFASTGAGTAVRLAAEVFARDAGIEMTHVPYQSGAAQLFSDLLTKRVQMVFYTYQVVKPHIDAGRLRALATTGSTRPDWMPDLPTLAELGYRRSVAVTPLGIYAPTGTPADRINRVAEAFRQMLDNAEFRAGMQADGTSVDFRTPAEFGVFAAADRARCRAMVEASGVRAQ